MEMRSNKNIRIGDVLQELGYINEDQINHRKTDVRSTWKTSEL